MLRFRPAVRDDVPTLVALLADDELGARRERFADPLPASYYDAFEALDRDPHNELVVAVVSREGKQGGQTEVGAVRSEELVVGMLQVTFIPYLTYQGGWRALIEGVRVAASHRGRGIGRRLFEWAIDRARHRGCHVVQLTTDKRRPDALRFYESLGFAATHEGMKLHLEG